MKFNWRILTNVHIILDHVYTGLCLLDQAVRRGSRLKRRREYFNADLRQEPDERASSSYDSEERAWPVYEVRREREGSEPEQDPGNFAGTSGSRLKTEETNPTE